MMELDLRQKSDEDGFVIYFGGRPDEINTYTFANALVALSDAFQEINSQVNPGFALELRLEAVSEGSFRARIREIPKPIRDAFKWSVNVMIMPILVTIFYENVIAPDHTKVIVNDSEVVIDVGPNKVIVPRESYERARAMPNQQRALNHVAKAIQVVEADFSVDSLGIFRDDDRSLPPALMIPRQDFAIVRREIEFADAKAGRRTIDQEVTLGILKAVFAKTARKWDFVWNGVRIGATIKDEDFMRAVMSREIRIGAGDAIKAVLEINQVWDEGAETWLNTSYRVAQVHQYLPGGRGEQLEFAPPYR